MSSPDFEAIKHLNPYNVEYWEARELQPLLGYKSWREFEGAIERAKTSCEATGNIVDDHFVARYKMIVDDVARSFARGLRPLNCSFKFAPTFISEQRL